MEKVIEVRDDRVLLEQNGEYYEKKIDTLERQENRNKENDLLKGCLGMND